MALVKVCTDLSCTSIARYSYYSLNTCIPSVPPGAMIRENGIIITLLLRYYIIILLLFIYTHIITI